MHISEYQRWLEEWDRARGWDRVLPSHTLVHALEEMGEVARLVLQWEGYKPAEDEARVQEALAEELSDLFVFLFKLAYQCGIDVEAALRAGQIKADRRYRVEDGAPELARYLEAQERMRARLKGDE
ncbi:MAG: hypothetical protein GXP39_04925 [Chloroflexi bacterium]|nr:hypothetical protein [Chloroflexota bacterium]